MKSDVQAFMVAHNARIAALAEQYIGHAAIAEMAGMTVKDKKRWYCRQLRTLAATASGYRRRCVPCTYGGALWTRYDTARRDIEALLDELEMELIDL